jgi:hypothetical protein
MRFLSRTALAWAVIALPLAGIAQPRTVANR